MIEEMKVVLFCFHANSAETTDIHVEKVSLNNYPTLHAQMNSQWNTGLNVKAKTIELLDRNFGGNFYTMLTALTIKWVNLDYI